MAGIRRTWDKEAYKQKAIERLERGDQAEEQEDRTESIRSKEEFKRASPTSDGPVGSERAFLNARKGKLDLEERAGKIEIIKPNQVNSAAGPGFYCDVCKCLLKDSASYLDHINGKRHQHALGFSMRVERADVSKVKEKMDALKRKLNEPESEKRSAVEIYEEKLENQLAEKERLKKLKKEREAALKKEREAAELEQGIDPEVAALMGFSGFK